MKRRKRMFTLWICCILMSLWGCVGPPPTLAPLFTALPTWTPPSSPTTSTAYDLTLTNTAAPTQAPSRTPWHRPTGSSTASPTPMPTALPTATPQPTATPLPLAEPTPVTLHTPDGLHLAAALYVPDGVGPFPAVLLSHMGGSNKEAWGRIPTLLKAAGYVVLTYDFRGQGGSEGKLDPPQAATDLSTALAYLRAQRSVDTKRIGLVGASMGGMASVIVAAGDPGVRAVVAISSPPDAAGQYPGQVVDQLSPRPLLALGCDQDPLTRPERVRQLYAAAGPPKRVVILECAAHANDILDTPAGPRLEDWILRWLNYYVKGR